MRRKNVKNSRGGTPSLRRMMRRNCWIFWSLYLEREGIGICKAGDGIEAMKIFGREEVHLALLDIMMPGLDGFAVLRKIRQGSRIPVIMLTAKSQDYDKILGLETGADDYITKPYNPLEVVARIKAQAPPLL